MIWKAAYRRMKVTIADAGVLAAGLSPRTVVGDWCLIEDLSIAIRPRTRLLVPQGRQPPAIAPTMRRGSVPEATASGSGAFGCSCEMSSPQAKTRRKGR